MKTKRKRWALLLLAGLLAALLTGCAGNTRTDETEGGGYRLPPKALRRLSPALIL